MERGHFRGCEFFPKFARRRAARIDLGELALILRLAADLQVSAVMARVANVREAALARSLRNGT